MQTRRRYNIVALMSALALAGGGAAAATCDATVHGELTHVERKDTVTAQTFSVNVTTMEPCATIHFALLTTERISKKKVKVVTTRDEVRLRNGSVSRILHHDMPIGRELVTWEVKVTGCERCEP